MGINEADIAWSDKAISALINGYTRESGVRNLEREVAGSVGKLRRK